MVAFGLTTNGNSKAYIDAHDVIKDLMRTGKVTKTSTGNFKVLEVKNSKKMINAVVEVISLDAIKGNVELKIYDTSIHKKKGANIELRKVPELSISTLRAYKKLSQV